jgi:carbon monoxide dehydrogenase subunit G
VEGDLMDNDVTHEVQINMPMEKVFAFLTNPTKIPLVLPGLIENSSIPKLPLKNGSKFNYKYRMFGVILTGTWKVTEITSPNTYSAKTDGDVKSQWHYILSKKGKGTLVNIHIQYDTPKSVLSKVKAGVVHSMNEKEIDHFAHNLKTVMELNT